MIKYDGKVRVICVTCHNMRKQNSVGFTLVEILVVMGLIAVLAGVLITAINPARQFALARNTQRSTDLAVILSAIYQNMAEHKGKFECASVLPSTLTIIKQSGGVDMRPCLVNSYLLELPVDPSTGTGFKQNENVNVYDTNYQIMQDTNTLRVTLRAPGAELGQIIELTR